MPETVKISRAFWVVIMVVALVVVVACGFPASPTEPPAPVAVPQEEAQPQPTVAAEALGIAPTQAPAAQTSQSSGQSSAQPAAPSPTATPFPAAMPEAEASGKDSIIVATYPRSPTPSPRGARAAPKPVP